MDQQTRGLPRLNKDWQFAEGQARGLPCLNTDWQLAEWKGPRLVQMDQQTQERSYWNKDLQLAEKWLWRFVEDKAAECLNTDWQVAEKLPCRLAENWQEDMTCSYAVAAVVTEVLAETEKFGKAFRPPDS
jgi:hypothetical protein